MTRLILTLAALFLLVAHAPDGRAQTLGASDFRIEWKVANRFRLFRDPAFFTLHENAWRQYLLHVDGLNLDPDREANFVARTSVLGSEHVLNDRRIAFTGVLRKNFDWRGWAARFDGRLCYDSRKRSHTACGGLDSYINPGAHEIEAWLTPVGGVSLPKGRTCEWRINGALAATADCGERARSAALVLPYPEGGDISVNVEGESPIIVSARVRDVLIAGLGDSFASGEGNPNVPVEFTDGKRYRSLYPLRKANHAGGSAEWTDQLCHRSLYGQQLRAALQIAVENPQAAVTFLDYSCSGAGVDDGILGPQEYVERIGEPDAQAAPAARPIAGGSRDSQLYRIMKELCLEKPETSDGQLICPHRKFRRNIDFVFLSIGGNDLGFSNIVAWATLRPGASKAIAGFFGATVSAKEFAERMRDDLPGAYARLAKALETSLPLSSSADGVFDPSRIVLTAYPDLVTDARGGICPTPREGEAEDLYGANQSLDMFAGWLTADRRRLQAVREQFGILFRRMGELAEDHGWTYAGHVYADGMFEGRGFCAQNADRIDDPAEALMIPCYGKAERPTQSCEQSWSGKDSGWRPYNPARQNYPYALRQRWVRTFNDAYMVINQKVADKFGKIDERTSAGVFSETTGALHPTAEGHAAMADALMLSVRPMVQQMLAPETASPLQ